MLKFMVRILVGILCTFLAIVMGNGLSYANGRVTPMPPLLTGIYTPGFIGERSVLRRQVQVVDAFINQKHSLVGFFIDLEADNPDYDISAALNRLYENGYTGFINFTTQRTAEEIASGGIDRAIERMARAYRRWAQHVEHPVAFIAPLPEMNGGWEVYGQTPDLFQQAYRHIQDIFSDIGVPDSTVQWVFAPNGWSEVGHEFEHYYPGDRYVDIVAFSAYNWGYCYNAAWQEWQDPATVFGTYIERMRRLAPEKPIFISQTATTSMTRTGARVDAKDEWLTATYQYLEQAGVRAVMYFNIDKECDWAVFSEERSPVLGYQQALMSSGIRYQSPAIVSTMF